IGVHAFEPGPQRFDREARTVAVVQLQQLLPRSIRSGRMPNPNRLRSPSRQLSRMKTGRGNPVGRCTRPLARGLVAPIEGGFLPFNRGLLTRDCHHGLALRTYPMNPGYKPTIAAENASIVAT